MRNAVYPIVLLCVVGCSKGNQTPKRTISETPAQSEITAEQAIRIAEGFIRANGYADDPPEDLSKLDVAVPAHMTDEDKKFLNELLAQRRNSIRPRAYGWRRGRRNDPNGWSVGFELVRTINNDPDIGQAVEMDEHGLEVWVEHMGFNLKSLPNKR
jgi:hypothetical protein